MEDKPRRGVDVVKAHLKTLPAKPGVYRMYDADGALLYVGKAKNLKARVASYATLAGHNNRIATMIDSIRSMEFTITNAETEALLLEANLIKRLRPRFNVILRDDKSFPLILIARDHWAPQILKHRGAKARPGDYFGPFASAGSVNRTLNTLQKAFLLRTCSDSVFETRTRPCLLHQIKRCAAPCVGYVSEAAYGELVSQARDFLSGRSGNLRKRLISEMEEAAQSEAFERAARLRDRIRALAAIQANQDINLEDLPEADVFAVAAAGGASCVQAYFYRAGQNWGNRAYFPKHERDADEKAVLSAFLAQFYDDRDPPKLILLDRDVPDADLLSEALTVRAGRKVQLLAPQRGRKRALVQNAGDNAREALGRKLAETDSQRRLLDQVRDVFGLEETPERIEIYDNSHIQGTDPVGAMVVAGPDGFDKRAYRKFNMKAADLSPGDDYAMMRAMLTRRFKRIGGPDATDASTAAPDLILIDGGPGQLSAALGVMVEAGVESLPVVAIAKGPDRDAGRERFFMPGREAFGLDPKSPALFFLQRLRDEAHRFAIGAHTAKRKKRAGANPLDDVPGVGAKRKSALLRHFGSARSVARAGMEDLESVDGVSRELAQRIYDHFHGGA